jgi:hypothetical protein
MASDVTGALTGRGLERAHEEIRVAEAARIVGLLDVTTLPQKAAQWVADGVTSANAQALAGLAAADAVPSSDGLRSALLAETASDLGLGFATTQEARTLHAAEIIRAMSAGENAGAQIYGLSNGFTDEVTGRLRGFLARLLKR